MLLLKYLSRKHQLQNIDLLADDVLIVFKALVTSCVRFKFETYDPVLLEKRWCAKQSLCGVTDGALIIHL